VVVADKSEMETVIRPVPASLGSDVKEADIAFPAEQDWTLHGRLFEPITPPPTSASVIVLSGAAAVPEGFYWSFARHLVRHGAAAVLTYDYRGIGRSSGDRSRWRDLRMADWGRLDFAAAIRLMVERFPDNDLVGCGHSYGGQAPGLTRESANFVRYGTVATMSGYWAKTDQPMRVWAQTQLMGRPLAALLGQVPKPLSVGEAMPGGIMLDWAKWIASRNYFFDDPSVSEAAHFADVQMPYLAVHVVDDLWGTRAAIIDFMRHYTGTDVRLLTLKPGESGPVGHLGFFRKAHSDVHWPVLTDWLLHGLMPQQTESVAQAALDLTPRSTK